MSNELSIAIALISFATGAGLSWVIFKNRLAIAIASLQSQVSNLEDAASKADFEVQRLSNKNELLENEGKTLSLEKARLTTELNAALQNLDEFKRQYATSLDQNKELQDRIGGAMQSKIIAERDLFNANNQIRLLQENESRLNGEVETLQQLLSTVKEDNLQVNTRYHETVKRLEDQQKFVEETNAKLKEAFQALSAEALKSNNESFVALAKSTLQTQLTEAKGDLEKKQQAIDSLIKPLSESLTNMNNKVSDLDNKRVAAYRDIWNYLEQVKQTTEGLRKETTNLVGALKTSHTRGRYGEIALKRLVEFAGMNDHCHFEEQVQVSSEEGKLRPDMIVMLPGNKKLVLDSKVPLAAYLRMFETEDPEVQKGHLNDHVTAVRDHFKKLSAKSYWSQFKEAPDFVIMYLHIESSFAVALQAYPQLIEEAFQNRIIIATPTILISILMSIGYSWNQMTTIENIEDIRAAAVELYERSTVLIDHIVNIGGSLKATVNHYNSAVGSLESKFMPQARKINNLSTAYTKKILKDLEPIDVTLRNAALPEVKADLSEGNLLQ